MSTINNFNMKKSTFSQNSGRGFCGGLLQWLVLLFVLLASTVGSQAANYPFPQNYKYPFGQIYTASGTTVKDAIQGLYTTWKSSYYTEGTMSGGSQSGKAAARIKFQDAALTVSEGIAYGMLVTVYMDNASNSTQAMFDKLWTYYQGNMDNNGVMNWKVNGFTGAVASGTGNEHGAPDADIDVATALLLADKQWGSAGTVNYAAAAKTLIDNIYTYEIDGNKLIKPGNAFNDYANPSYYITNGIKLFAKFEMSKGLSDRWSTIADACYTFMQGARSTTSYLVPDWANNGTKGTSGTAISGIVSDKFESYFLYDAIRIPWRMSMAYAWWGDTKAQEIASKITTWAIGATGSDPANAVDGYELNGSVFANTTVNPNFTTLGKNHNPCFSGGISIGSMVNASASGFTTYMGKCWSVGSKIDAYPAYFTSTTQLLYMLALTGNMPNFWDMKPVATAAETDANGTLVYIDFTKAIDATSASSTTAANWTLNTYSDLTDLTATKVAVSSVAIDPTNAKRIVLTLAASIAEPVITINYAGTILKGTDAAVVDPFGPFSVTNKITNMEPYAVTRITNVTGTQVVIQWSKAIAAASVKSAEFSVKINGVAVTAANLSAAVDATDATMVNLTLSGSLLVTKATDVITVSYSGVSLTGTTSAKIAKAFTDAPVQNFYMNVTCYTICNFDGTINASFAGWTKIVSWSSTATDPVVSTNKVGNFYGDNSENYPSAKATLTAANIPNFNAAFSGTGALFKARIYIKSGFAAGEKVKIVVAHAALANAGSYYDKNQVEFDFLPTAGSWVDVSAPITGVVDQLYDYIAISTTGISATNFKSAAIFYIDDISICPPPPTVNFVNGKSIFDGSQVEIKLSTAMKLPTNLNTFTITVDGVAVGVTKIEAKQGDASSLVLTLATPIPNAAADVLATYTGSTGTAYAVDGRTAELFSNKPIANLYGISVTTGWRDDFKSLTDFVTLNIGTGTSFTGVETVTTSPVADYYTITGKAASVKWDPIAVTTYGTGATDLKQVMDLTGRETVSFSYRVPAGNVSKTLWVRINFKDLVNGYTSDAMTFVSLPITTAFTTQTFNVGAFFIQKYDAAGNLYSTPLVIDRTNIQQVSFNFIEAEGTAANGYLPTNFNGKIDFDYISIGSALILSNVPASVNENAPVTATSSATGQIFLVPAGTPPMLKSFQDSVFAGKGVVVSATASTAASIATTGLKAGYYEAYAYDPAAGALSAKVGVNIADVTAPIITQASSGNLAATATITATVNEDATLYLIPATGVTTTSLTGPTGILNMAIYSIDVAKNVLTAIALSDIAPAVIAGQTYVFIAVDYAAPAKNISAVSTPIITITSAPLTVSVAPSGIVNQGSDVVVTTNRTCTAYLVPSTVLVTSANISTSSVKSVIVASTLATISTTGVALGDYYVYVSDGSTIVGPSSKITVSDNIPPVLSAYTTGSVVVATGTITATSNEVGKIYLVKAADIAAITDTTSLKAKAVIIKAATANTPVSFLAAVATGDYVLFASDAAGNISTKTAIFSVVVGCVNVATLAAAPSSLIIKVGDAAAKIAVTVATPTNATALNNALTTFDPDVAGVVTIINNGDGTCSVTGNSTVTASTLVHITCTVTDCGPKAVTIDIPVTVNPLIVCPTKISIAPTPQDIQIGALGTLTTTITGSLGASNVSWSSESPAVASIATPSNTGATITPSTLGTTIITASVLCNSVTISGTATVNVVKTPVTSISVTSSNPVSIVVGSTSQITAFALPTVATNSKVSYTSNAPLTASVDPTTGLITAKAVGTCTITVASIDDPTVTKVIPVTVTALKVSTLTASPSTVTVSMGSTGTATIIFNPLTATNKALTVTSANSALVTGSYNAATNLLTVTGVGMTTGTILTLTSSDGPTVPVTVIVTCPTVSPTATEIPNVSTCTSAPAPLVATLTSTTAKAVWYSVQTGGTALATGNTYVHGKTGSGVTSYYVAQTDNGCESSNRVTVTLTINANPVPTITTPTATQAFCITNTTASTLAATPTAGTFTIDGTTQTKLNPSTLSAGSHTVAYSVTSLGCTGTASTSVTIDAAPAITITSVPTLCSTGSAVALSATPTGGAWSGTAVTGSSFNPALATAGANTATYTAISGSCTVTKDLTVTVNTTPAPSFSGLPASICKGATALTLPSYVSIANGTFTENLGNVSGSTFTPSIVGKSIITYSVTSGGCVGTKSATVTVNDVPAITITPLGTICSNAGKQTLVATPANGTWSGSTAINGTQFDPSVVSAGSYPISYAYTDGTTTCSSSKSITVVVNNAPVPTAANASINVGGTPSSMTATGTGSITWYSADKTTVLVKAASYTPTDPTTTNGTVYTYYISNTINGCESDKVAVTLTVTSCTTPAPTAASVLTLCEGLPIPALTATGTSLKWYEADGTTLLTSGPSYTTTVTSVGTHTFKVSQTLNGCEGTQATASVTIDSKPVALTVANVSVCEGSTAVALTATSTGTVSWLDNKLVVVATTLSYTPTVTATGTYTYTPIQKVGNCSSDASTVTYTILAKPAAPTITNVSVCEGATPYQITASGTNVTWYDSKGVQLSTGATLKPTTITGASVNSYSATQTSGTCISDKATGTLTVNALPVVTLTGSASLCSNASPVSLTASPIGGTFTGAGVNTVGLFDPSIVTTGANVITYSYTDAQACSNSKTLSITVNSSANPIATGSSCLVGAASIPAMTATGSGTIQWYSSSTSTTLLATGNSYVSAMSTGTAGTTIFYVENLTASGCTSGRVPVTVTISNCATVAPIVTSATICEGDATGILQATGTGIIWYDAKSVQVGTGTTYKPTDKTAGTFTYYASQTTTCESPKAPATYTINGLPSVSFPAVSPLCFNGTPLTLSASPANGIFTGTGVANGKLTPSQSIAGDIPVTYTYTDAATNCSAKAVQTITVNYVAPPTVNPSTNITQVNVAPAVFNATGSGVLWYSDASLLSNVSSGLTFQAPTVSNTGTTTFYLTQTVNSCTSNAALAVVSVTSCATGLPTVTNAESCIGVAAKALTATGTGLQWYSDVALTSKISVATPASFVPTIDIAKAGTSTFYVTQTIGCEGPAVAVTYTVNALPVVTFDIVPSVCSSVTTATALVGTPIGGTFSGAVTTASFIPSVLGIGQHPIIYSYTNANGCVNTATQTVTINDCSAPKVSAITITPTLSVDVNATGTVSVLQLLPVGASTSVTWVVNNTDTASVLADGTVTGLKAGTTSIVAKATDGSGIVSNKCIVTVKAIVKTVTSVTFSNTAAISITETGTVDLSKILVINPTDATVASISWTSLNPTVASVDATTGVVSGKAVSADAPAIIQVSVVGTDGKTTTQTITITVVKNAVLVTSISLDVPTMTLEVGKTGKLAASVLPIDATETRVTFISSDASVASVDPSSGLVTAGKIGTALITATSKDGGYTAKCDVTVTDIALTQITFKYTIVDCPAKGTIDLSSLTVTGIGFIPTNAVKNINWSVAAADASKGTINLTSGVFTPLVSNGVVTVTATNTLNNVSQTIQVNITTNNVSVISVTVTPLATTTITFDQFTSSAAVQLAATIAPIDASNQTVTWSLVKAVTGVSVDVKTGNITFTGIVSDASNGPVIIQATSPDGGKNGTITLNILFKYKVESVKINTLPTSINQGDQLQLDATEKPTAANTGKAIVWSIQSPNSTGSTISTTGVLTAGTTDGIVTVVASVTDDDGKVYSSTVDITVKKVEVLTDITVNFSTTTLQKGDTKTIAVTYVPATTGQTGVTYTISPSDSKVISVDGSGNIIALKGGQATITVTPTAKPSMAKTIVVTVTEKVSSISLANSNPDLIIGSSTNVSATIKETSATDQIIEVTSSDPTIASVLKVSNTEYTVTAKGEGTAIITAVAHDGSGQTASISINVAKTPVESISINAVSTTLHVGETKDLSAVTTVLPSIATYKNVTWTSSNPSVASVTAGTIKGLTTGIVTFTVTSNDDPSISSKITFTVIPTALDTTAFNKAYIAASNLIYTLDPKTVKENPIYTNLYDKLIAAKVISDKYDTKDPALTQTMIDKATKDLQTAITQVNCNCYVGVGEVEASEVVLYPNPVVDVLNVKAESLESVQVIDLNGKSIFNTQENTIDFSGVSSGIYEVIVKTKAKVSIQKIIKQ